MLFQKARSQEANLTLLTYSKATIMKNYLRLTPFRTILEDDKSACFSQKTARGGSSQKTEFFQFLIQGY